MKYLLKIIYILIIIYTLPLQLFAQAADTLDITALPPGNINNVIAGDTVAGGTRAHPNRVYRLQRGFVYQVTQPMRINGHLNIIATGGTNRPPVLAPAILPDNSSIDHFFSLIGKGSKAEISNIYILSMRADNNGLNWSDGIRVNGDSINLKLRGVIFDAFSHRGVSIGAKWSKLDIQDCHFRNHQHGSAYFGGAPIESDGGTHMDTCIVINNTFFANNATAFSIRGYDRYSRFEHNTIVYGAVYPFLIRQATNLHIKNNLLYSAHSYGGIPDHIYNSWFLNFPDTVTSGIFVIRTRDTVSTWAQKLALVGGDPILGPEVYVDSSYGVYANMLLPEFRTFEIKNNYYFWPQALKDFYNAYNDTVQTRDTVTSPSKTVHYLLRKLTLPEFITEYCQYTFDNLLANKSSIQIENNNEADPGFNSDIINFQSSVINYVSKIATRKLDNPWHYPNTGTLYPPIWPLPENLVYSNTAPQQAGTDGFALGDLNWFPDQKAQWLVTGVEENNDNVIPGKYSLSEAYPNPFNPVTNFKFNLPDPGNVRIIIFNILGQKVKTLLNAELNSGSYTANWDATDDFGNNVSSGIYFFRLESGAFNSTKKLVLMR